MSSKLFFSTRYKDILMKIYARVVRTLVYTYSSTISVSVVYCFFSLRSCRRLTDILSFVLALCSVLFHFSQFFAYHFFVVLLVLPSSLCFCEYFLSLYFDCVLVVVIVVLPLLF